MAVFGFSTLPKEPYLWFEVTPAERFSGACSPTDLVVSMLVHREHAVRFCGAMRRGTCWLDRWSMAGDMGSPPAASREPVV